MPVNRKVCATRDENLLALAKLFKAKTKTGQVSGAGKAARPVQPFVTYASPIARKPFKLLKEMTV